MELKFSTGVEVSRKKGEGGKPRTTDLRRGFEALPFREVRNIHPRTHVRGVLWYGVNSRD